MKRALVAVVLASTIAVNGCIGSFSLTNNLYKWNEKATDSKYVNSAILWVLGILPVYDITLFVDFVLFNTIEFYGGKNPVAFTSPQKTEKVVMSGGKTYKLTMGDNAMVVDRLDGTVAVREFAVRYDKSSSSFFMDDRYGTSTKVASIDQSTLKVYSPDGRVTVRSLAGDQGQVHEMAFAR
jgi:hypothetical protein